MSNPIKPQKQMKLAGFPKHSFSPINSIKFESHKKEIIGGKVPYKEHVIDYTISQIVTHVVAIRPQN